MNSNSQQNFILFLIMIGLGSYFGYQYIKTPCLSPTTYKIGAFDQRFNISRDDFLNVTQDAINIWEKPLNKKLFSYDENGEITINLIYDERQKTTEERSLLQADSEKIKSLAGSVKEQYTTLENQYKIEQDEYELMLSAYNQKQEAYNTKVQYWNARGGAPENEYNQLLAEKNDLSNDYDALETKRQDVNARIKEINTFIDKYNLLVSTVNKNIDTINKTAGAEFQEGTYDPNTKTITIYEFDSKVKLERVLSHEFGHALGLDHNSNPQSIMHAVNQSTTLVASEDDIASLKEKCRLN